VEHETGMQRLPLTPGDGVLDGFACSEAARVTQSIESIEAVAPCLMAVHELRSRDIAWKSQYLGSIRDQLHYHLEHQHLDVMGRVFHAMPARSTRASFSALLGTSQNDLEPHEVLHFGSYNYAGLNGHPRVVAAAASALQRYGTTISGVRLLNGTCELHLELEQRLARFLGFEDCVTYSSGYLANISVLGALCSEQDIVLSDTLNHRSILDGLRLSRADVRTFRHKSVTSLEFVLKDLPRTKRKFIVTDGVFSMDGDVADLPSIIELAERYHAYVIVDDAHATAAIGPHGRGTPALYGSCGGVDVLTGSLSKGLPGIGGFAAGPKSTMDLLRIGSNGYVFSASIPPSIAAGLIEAIQILEEQPEIQERLHHNERYLRAGIQRLGLDCMNSASPVIPILMPTYDIAADVTRRLHRAGIYVNAVGYPAVSKKRMRLRVNVSANLEQHDLDRFLDTLGEITRALDIAKFYGTQSSEELEA